MWIRLVSIQVLKDKVRFKRINNGHVGTKVVGQGKIAKLSILVNPLALIDEIIMIM